MSRRGRVRQAVWQQGLLVLFLVILWVMLWDQLNVLNIVTGLVLAIFVTRVFYLPPVELSGRFNFFYAAVFLAWFLGHMVAASFQVAWSAVRPRGVNAGSVIELDLHTRSDLLISGVSVVLGLIPGSIAIEIDRPHSVIYVHVLDCATDEAVDAARAQIYRIEYFLIASFGSAHDITALNEWRAENGRPPVLASRSVQQRASHHREKEERR